MKASIAAAPREREGKKTINTRNPGQKFPSFFRGASPLRSECIGVVCQWSQRAVKNFQFFRAACISPCPCGGFGSPGRMACFALLASGRDVADSGPRKA
ncbi:hypothetical protein TNIN_323391 [Trichonephila inaurata madagascariensis]|uniref:Uncharacterized protein n=1 Tax=Trichonephila inaurata madagascariensis TaxID=2747483 RepID=A0A8X7BSP9_9ARAC|nr:hypothetical protein TNIN_323391 [Trichonephila inaurata madagascariensis]